MNAEPMSRSDRETLIKIARQRERVAKTEAKERAARLMADFEAQMDRCYSYDENAVWEKAYATAEATIAETNAKIAEECARLGIPKEFAPSLVSGWMERGRNTVKKEREEMRRVATRQIEAAEKAAFAAIEKQSLSIQESIMVGGLTSDDARVFLATMPTVEALMPMLAADDVKAMIEHRRDDR